ncbi:hypothetical protein [Paraburkholderia humisilvae]|uniref:DUF1845 domain-containing protein n=1 Tax=Paraburkholderia humisilvae TaxID=627669 RepID=A0A6J5EQG2_9BURK|nr:hypothetical protein [Paraburkholderia humisilvae]CAB3767452.1 hypothetical protein LMG29542_05611 [Paraburkholderia humisilvae]
MTIAESVNLLRPTVTMQVAEFARETFGRQMRGALEKEPVEFGSSIVQSFVRRDYTLLNKNLHFAIDAPRTLPRYDATACDEIDELFRKKIGETIAYVNNLKQQLWQLFQANAIEPSAEFPSVLKQDLLYASPHAKNYIKLLRIADEYMLHLWSAYLNGLVSARDRHGEELKVRKRIRSITNLARDVKFQTYKKFNAWQASEQARTGAATVAATPVKAPGAESEPPAPTGDAAQPAPAPSDEAHAQAA